LGSWWGGEKPGFYLGLGGDGEVEERNPVSWVPVFGVLVGWQKPGFYLGLGEDGEVEWRAHEDTAMPCPYGGHNICRDTAQAVS
jgi:hypothetical protein